ncbi:MAG TPA: PfkB family carbohydrate kinase [Lentimicrobium sp.]|nr:PfkB family carbohydrate kinase [Lentimicrobium sp.]
MIYCVGETLYDIVFRNEKPEWALPGGGMFNCAMSLSHAGADVQLITELGDDKIGNLIRKSLNSAGVKDDYLRISNNNSTLALAFLDVKGNADYQFYKAYPEKAPELTVPDFRKEDVLIFGSLYSVDHRNRGNIIKLAMAAKNTGTIIIYDPNFRKSHAAKLPDVLPLIKENVSLADIVRGSDEDFSLISDAESSMAAYDFIQQVGCKNLIVTRNSQGVDLFAGETPLLHFDALPVKIVSTIGAGDAFNAGFACQVHQFGRIPSSPEEWNIAISNGLSFAAEVCASRDNYIKPHTK